MMRSDFLVVCRYKMLTNINFDFNRARKIRGQSRQNITNRLMNNSVLRFNSLQLDLRSDILKYIH